MEVICQIAAGSRNFLKKYINCLAQRPITAYSVILWRKVFLNGEKVGFSGSHYLPESAIVLGTRRVSGHQYNQSGRKGTDGDASSLS